MAIETLSWSGAVGAAATPATTGYDDMIVVGGSATFDGSWQPRNRPSVDANGTATAGYVLGQQQIAATDVLAYDQPIKPVTLPASETAVLSFFNSDGSEDRQFSIVTDSTGMVKVRDDANANVYESAAGVLAPGVPVILSVYFTRHPTAGTFRVAVFNEDGTTVRLGADSGLQTAKNTGALSITRVKSTQAKSGSTSTVVARHLFGRPRWDRSASGLLPAFSGHVPFRVGVGGVHTPVKLMRSNGAGGFESIVG